MNSLFYVRKECRICAEKLTPALLLTSTPAGDKYVTESQKDIPQEAVPLDLYLCNKCGLTQLAYVIRPEALYGDYIYETSVSLGLSDHFKTYAEGLIQSLKLVKNDLVIDIGSNDGTLLSHFRKSGMRVLGVEPSPAGIKAQSAGIDTVNAYFSEDLSRQLQEKYGPAKVVTANNVFANIDSLDEFMRGVHQLLAPDGVFIFETFYLVDVLQKFLPETIFHEHLCYFTLHPLMTLFQRYGMQVFDAVRVPTKGGSLRGFVQLSGAGRGVTSRVEDLLALERSVGTGTPAVFGRFTETMTKKKTELHNTLSKLKGANKAIVGYGASVGVTTLIYQFDVAGYLDYLVDDNTAKHHRFSPGYHLPVLPSQVLYDRKPDYALILAWGYARPIISKHQAFLNQGGHFVVPLPEVAVV